MSKIINRRGFTLFELIIVIFLVSLVAYFVFTYPQKYAKKQKRVTLSNLSKYLRENFSIDGELICFDKCKKCIFLTEQDAKEIAIPIKLSIKAQYIVDDNDNPIRVDLGRFKDKKVCLRVHRYRNGSTSQLILEKENGEFYYLPTYFGKGKKFDSLQGAVDAWIGDNRDILRSRGDWY